MSSPSTVTIVSECFIKPLHDLSPETKQPLHFAPFELSFLNFNYIQKGLLFSKPPENKGFSITAFLDDLKNSLSATLTHFYPLVSRLATRIQDDHNPPSYVIYLDPKNRPGVKFIYAKTDATILDIINPTYVPLIVGSFFDLNNAISHDGHTLPLVSIKVTELTDGIFIGGSINHVVADGTSFWHFMTSWSEIFKSKNRETCIISRTPVFKRLALEGYDPRVNLPYTHHGQFIERSEHPQDDDLKERFFHFSSASVARLKNKANAELSNNNNTQKKIISSLQAVSALLWRCITRVRRQPGDSETECVLAVCNRRRINPPLSDGYFGSPVLTVKGTKTVEELMKNGLGWAALYLHETITNHDDEAVKKWAESWFRNPVAYKISDMLSPFSNVVLISSSPRFDMYGCEFGLGKAVAVRSGPANKGDGAMTMYPGREGGGSIDVEVCLSAETMKDLEHEEEFISALKE
uniref:uncharacterized acetyltransferase At3g50280-like n=1 Tax=Erigeron canadensis TaxID=72917 RepID=UPI001CB91935|nr:uncharacterized acetyltransferase At3g50280-like [Erigeron canadensis]